MTALKTESASGPLAALELHDGEAVGTAASTGAQVKEARIALEDTKLKTPTAALVLKRKIEVGDLVNAGTPGFTLARRASSKAPLVPLVAITARFGSLYFASTSAWSRRHSSAMPWLGV